MNSLVCNNTYRMTPYLAQVGRNGNLFYYTAHLYELSMFPETTKCCHSNGFPQGC